MKTILFACTFLFFLQSELCNAQNFVWAKQIGGNDEDTGNDIAVDAVGNTYVCGSYSDTCDFDPSNNVYSLIAKDERDAFVAKYDSSGSLIWAKGFGGNYNDHASSLAIDLQGNLIICGTFYDTVDFDPGLGVYTLTGYYDFFIMKLDASGNFVWADRFGSTGQYDLAYEIKLDNSGIIYTVGTFSNTVDFDPSNAVYNLVSSFLDSDVFILKLDNDGNFIWAKALIGTDWDYGESIDVDNAGNVYTVGWFQNTIDVDPGTATYDVTATGSSDVFISKLDPSGNFQWGKSFSGLGIERGRSIIADDAGNVYVTGSFDGNVDFDPNAGVFNLTSTFGSSPFIAKLDSSGNLLWAKYFYESEVTNCDAYEIIQDNFGNIYVSGALQGTVDFDPDTSTMNLSSIGASDIFIAKLDSNGNFIWAIATGGSPYDEQGYGLALDPYGYLYATGFFFYTTDFDPSSNTFNITSFGMDDAYVLKLKSNPHTVGISDIDKISDIKLYPNPANVGEVKIALDGLVANYSYEIFGIDGKKRTSSIQRNSNGDILLFASLASGVYFLRCSSDSNVFIKKFVAQ